MTLANPPYPYFNGITYNSQFFNTSTPITSSSGGLTQAQANLLYLQKTTNDTATALETFSAGILTNTIGTISASELTIGGTNGIITTKLNSQIGTGLFIGSNSTAGVFIGNIGNTLGRVVTINDTLSASTVNTIELDNPTGELIIGVEATSVKLSYKYDPLGVLLYTSSIETDSTLTSNTINFHSNAEFETEYDSRIVATGGTNTNGQGTLALTANTIQLTGNTAITGTATIDNLAGINSFKPNVVYLTAQVNTLTLASFTTNGTIFGSTFTSATPSVANDNITINLPTPTAALDGMTFTFRKIRGALNGSSTNFTYVTSPASIVQTSLSVTGQPLTSNPVNGIISRIQVFGFGGSYYWFAV